MNVIMMVKKGLTCLSQKKRAGSSQRRLMCSLRMRILAHIYLLVQTQECSSK